MLPALQLQGGFSGVWRTVSLPVVKCTQVIFRAAGSGASGSSTISTRLLAFGGTPVQASGGDTSCPSQVYLAGISPPWGKAVEVSLRVLDFSGNFNRAALAATHNARG
jgi:hypothetical protein